MPNSIALLMGGRKLDLELCFRNSKGVGFGPGLDFRRRFSALAIISVPTVVPLDTR